MGSQVITKDLRCFNSVSTVHCTMCHPRCRFTHFTTKEASLQGFYAFEQGQLQSSPVSRRVRNVEFEVKLALLRRTVHLLLLLAYQIPKHFISPDSLKSLSS